MAPPPRDAPPLPPRAPAEDERAQRLRLLESAVARLNDIVVITEAEPFDGPGPRIVFVNDAFERRTGWRADEVIGKTPRILQGPATQRAELDRIRSALQRWEPVRAELINYTKAGEPFWLELDIVPLADENGWYTHWVSIERDITQRKAMEQADEQAQRLESLGQLTGGVAHDFNNLLTVMMGNAELLSEHLAHDETGRRLAQMVSAAAQRGAELTQRLLAFGRRQHLAPQAVELHALLSELGLLLRRTLGRHVTVDVVVDLAGEAAPWRAHVDAAKLETALLNLALNARDAMPEGGRLRLSAGRCVLDATQAVRLQGLVPGDYVVLEVADTGSGMSPEVLARVFEPFYTTRPRGQGTGLGLAMVYGFVRQSQGAVTIESAPGRGTTVRLYLPRARVAGGEAGDEAADSDADAATPGGLPGGDGALVLLVEDDPLVRQHALAQLDALGYRTLQAANAGEALALLGEHPQVRLLFTDVLMPGGVDGRALAASAQALRPGLPVLYTSGYADQVFDDATAPVAAGPRLLGKPYRRAELAQALHQALHGDVPAAAPAPAAETEADPAALAAARLLILDDDPMIGLTIQLMAERTGATARLSTEPEDFFAAVDDWQPTHLCIDLNMPAMDGLAVLAELGRRGCRAQIVISSGVGQRVLDAAGRSAAEHGLHVGGVLAKPPQLQALRRLLAAPGPAAPTPAPVRSAPPRWTPDLRALDQALVRGELVVHYQPLVDCRSGSLHGLEALVRWQHPQHGLVPPDRFIALAESHGRIDELTLQVLRQALAWFVPWRAQDAQRAQLTLSINLSAGSLGNADFAPRLRQACEAAGMDPAHLVFELTESSARGVGGLTLELVTRLRVQGFSLALDDFGTCYSSLLQLRRLPFSEIKIDREFVADILRSEESKAIVRFTIELGRSLGLRSVAEGVEDAATLDVLRELGCDLVQGYYVSRPLSAAGLEAWVQMPAAGTVRVAPAPPAPAIAAALPGMAG